MNQLPRLDVIEADIQAIKERNARVAADKAWETSWFRVLSICVITYFIAAAVMWGIGVQRVWFNALIPTIGYFLSTQSLPAIKRWWIHRHLN